MKSEKFITDQNDKAKVELLHATDMLKEALREENYEAAAQFSLAITIGIGTVNAANDILSNAN